MTAVRELRCTGTPEFFDIVQDALAGLWTDAPDVGTGDRMLFETALVEIVGNLVEHARTSAGNPVNIALELAVEPLTVRARMQDDGQWPPSEATDISGAALPQDELAEGGRGLAMAAALAEVTYTRVVGGNVWTVVRHRA